MNEGEIGSKKQEEKTDTVTQTPQDPFVLTRKSESKIGEKRIEKGIETREMRP